MSKGFCHITPAGVNEIKYNFRVNKIYIISGDYTKCVKRSRYFTFSKQ